MYLPVGILLMLGLVYEGYDALSIGMFCGLLFCYRSIMRCVGVGKSQTDTVCRKVPVVFILRANICTLDVSACDFSPQLVIATICRRRATDNIFAGFLSSLPYNSSSSCVLPRPLFSL